MKFNQKYINRFIFSLAAVSLLGACTDDKLRIDDGSDPLLQEGEGIALTLSLPCMTRAGESYDDYDFEKFEDYVDQKKINLLFFYADNPEDHTSATDPYNGSYDTLIKQFSGSELSVIPIETTATGDLKRWYVKLPILDETFAKELRDHDFKVAALVNWTNEKVDLAEAEFTQGVLTKKGDHVNKLHHLQEDSKYEGDAYNFLLDKNSGNKMGMRFNWVSNTHDKAKISKESGKGSAERWIRTNWFENPEEEIYSSYREIYGDLWLLWSFDGARRTTSNGNNVYSNSDIGKSYDLSQNGVTNEDIAWKWAIRNYEDMHDWMYDNEQNKYKTNLDNLKIVNKVTTDSGEKEIPKDNGDFRYTGTAQLVEQGGIYGVKISARPDQSNVFTFNLVASGCIRVKWSSETSGSKLTIERRNDPSDSQAKNPETFTIKETNKTQKDEKDYTVTGDSEYVYIYCSTGDAIIYEIEYIADEYLYGIEREGVTPSEAQGIPMYGIQKYLALEGYWKEGTLFNLSDFNNLSTLDTQYEYLPISLLRSVAKVELLIPSNFNAHHVFLRCQNRYGRYEPMDVSTPTNEIWLDTPNSTSHSKFCEWNHLIGHTPFYNNSTYSYQKLLAWYYGSWASSYDVNGNPSPLNLGGVEVPNIVWNDKETVEGFPRIINPRIERSDFTKFIHMGKAMGIYERYVLYVPDKFVDDPNKDGGLTENPKVCHIEFRRGEMTGYDPDPIENLDDNNCYRIYFTENGYNSDPEVIPVVRETDSVKETWENKYEQNIDNLKKHWPIMRNHVYSFIVDDASQAAMIIKLEVLPWKNVEQNTYVW